MQGVWRSREEFAELPPAAQGESLGLARGGPPTTYDAIHLLKLLLREQI